MEGRKRTERTTGEGGRGAPRQEILATPMRLEQSCQMARLGEGENFVEKGKVSIEDEVILRRNSRSRVRIESVLKVYVR